jgi:Tfp pilus assembly protein PilE
MRTSKQFGFTGFEILIIVAIVALIAAIVMSSFIRGRNTSCQNACIGNMRIIDAGKEQWAMANKLTDGCPVVAASVNQYLKGNTTPICPAGGTYTYENIGSQPECSITTPTSHIFGGGRY